MPIPKYEDGASREEIIKIYEENGWYKTITFDWIEVDGRTGTIHKKVLRFTADTLPCDVRECKPHMLTFVQLRPTGVMKTCAVCGKTEGPISTEDGELLSDTTISRDEALKIIRKTGQIVPIGLVSGGRRGRPRIRR